MKLTAKEALKLLNDCRGLAPDDNWINHSIVVGDTAGVIASKVGLDEDKARTLGYIHDIGKRNGFGGGEMPHPIGGYEYLTSLRYGEEYSAVCLTHSYIGGDIRSVAGVGADPSSYRYDFVRDFVENHPYTEEEKLINLCDLMCFNKVMVVEQRICGIVMRRGVPLNVPHLKQALALKKYFDDKLGYNLYSLFPEIIK